MASSKRNEIRQAFQQRVKRFSAFEMLGLDGESSPSTDVLKEDPDHISNPPSEPPSEDISIRDVSEGDISDGLRVHQTVPSEGTSDGLRVHQTVPSEGTSDPHLSDPMIHGDYDDTSDSLIQGEIDTSHEFTVSSSAPRAIPLAPLQWRVWQALRDTEGKVVSLKGLATQVSGSIPGVRQAIQVIEREGGVLSRETIREKTQEGAILQGFRIALNHAISFQQVTSKEAHRVQKRGLIHHHISDGLIYPPGDTSDRLRMYVCKRNTYIRAENLAELLRIAPAGWQIREPTLIQIADTFPSMTALEFRLSLKRLIQQASTGKQVIQNPNAWLKAAFEKNGGPLVTEREIEVRLERSPAEPPKLAARPKESDDRADVLQRYIDATAEERATIDQQVEQQLRAVLATVSEKEACGHPARSPDCRHPRVFEERVRNSNAERQRSSQSSPYSGDAGE